MQENRKINLWNGVPDLIDNLSERNRNSKEFTKLPKCYLRKVNQTKDKKGQILMTEQEKGEK